MGRAPCCDKANVKKGPWSPEEDATLKAYIEKYGTGGNWIALPQKIGLKRCGKSCRLRWLNYLRPNIKHGGFTEEEDNIILSLYISIGSRWSIIAAQLPGRTDNDIKNYWNTRLKKKLLGRKRQQQQQNGCKDELSSSALERLQLHMQLQSQQGLQNSLSLFNNHHTILPKLHPLIQDKLIQNNLHSLNSQMIQYPNYNGLDFLDHTSSNLVHLQEDHTKNNNDNNNNNNNSNKGIIIVNKEQVIEELESSSLNGSASSGSSNLVNNNNSNDNNNNNNNNNNNEVMKNSNIGKYVDLKPDVYTTGMQRVLSFQAELNELLASDKVGNIEFEGINSWWSNDSSSTISWDASNVVLQSDNTSTMLYNQDYA